MDSSFPETPHRNMARHRRDKAEKCNLCVFEPIDASDLRAHMKITLRKSPTNAASVTMRLFV